jgi:enoyl-CoA hydratase/carnithine racemase
MIEVEAGEITRITIARPQVRNAIDLDTIVAIEAALDATDARVFVLTGAGDKVFCAGADLAQVAANPEGRRAAAHAYARLLGKIARSPRPVVARVNGHCLAGGVGLLLACDLAVMVDDATVQLPEAAVGMWPAMVGAFLVREVGRKRALELAMTGRKLTAADALEWGMVNRVRARDALDAGVAEVCGAILARSPSALRIGRRAWADAQGIPLEEGLSLLADRLGDVMDTEDAVEGFTAFLTKRPPAWKDR